MTLDQLIAQLECVVTPADRDALSRAIGELDDVNIFGDQYEKAAAHIAQHRTAAVREVLQKVMGLLNKGA